MTRYIHRYTGDGRLMVATAVPGSSSQLRIMLRDETVEGTSSLYRDRMTWADPENLSAPDS